MFLTVTSFFLFISFNLFLLLKASFFGFLVLDLYKCLSSVLFFFLCCFVENKLETCFSFFVQMRDCKCSVSLSHLQCFLPQICGLPQLCARCDTKQCRCHPHSRVFSPREGRIQRESAPDNPDS